MITLLCLVLLPVLIVALVSLFSDDVKAFVIHTNPYITALNIVLLVVALVAANFVRLPLGIQNDFWCWLANFGISFLGAFVVCFIVFIVRLTCSFLSYLNDIAEEDDRWLHTHVDD